MNTAYHKKRATTGAALWVSSFALRCVWLILCNSLQRQDGLKANTWHIHALHLRSAIDDNNTLHRAFMDGRGRCASSLALCLLCHDHQLQSFLQVQAEGNYTVLSGGTQTNFIQLECFRQFWLICHSNA